jgi:hypothetical protein
VVSILDEGGDHLCVVTEPIDVTAEGPFEPLRLSDVVDLTPGHEAEERPSPPTQRARSRRHRHGVIVAGT